MTVAQRRAKSPIPGIVVIVLATAAVVFGVAVVQRPAGQQALASELASLRGMVDELQTAQEKLRRTGDRTRSGLSSLQEELSSSSVALASLEERLARRSDPAPAVEDRATQGGAGDDALFAEALLELTAELRAIQSRVNELELDLDSLPTTTFAVQTLDVAPTAHADRFAGGMGEPMAAELAAVQPDDAPAASSRGAEAEAAATPQREADQDAQAEAESDVEPGADALAAARAAAAEHAELLAPFFGAGCEQPDGSRTREPGPMSLDALVHSGALAPLTSDVPEQNDALRTLAEVASNAPNDRPLWPYGRGSRAVWYLRRDGRADVPLAHGLLVQHGRAFVELGLLAR